MKAQVDWNSGNFSLSHATDELTDEQVQALVNKGLLWHCQRNKDHDVILGAFETVDGKQKRRKDWKRNDVDFSEQLAKQLAKSYAEIEVAKDDEIDVRTVVGAYEREAAELKFKAEKAKIAEKGGDAVKLQALADAVKYDGENLTVENVDFLRAIKAHVDAKLREARAGI